MAKPRLFSLTCSFLKFLNIKFRKGHYNNTIRIISTGIVSTTIIFGDEIILLPIEPLSGDPIHLGMPEKTTDIIKALFQWELFPLNKYTIANYFKSCTTWS